MPDVSTEVNTVPAPAADQKRDLEWVLRRAGGYEWLLKELNVLPGPYHIPTRGQMMWVIKEGGGEQELLKLLKERNDATIKQQKDPFNHGYESKQWADADKLILPGHEVFVSGPNRSSKSFWAARTAVNVLARKQGSIVWCISPSEERSKDVQQRYIYHYLPLQWKNSRRVKGIKWNDRTRFSDNFFVTPIKSECIFKNCNQEAESTIEGGQVDMIWIDEAVDLDRLNRLRGRTVDRGGVIIWTYTPIDGYTLSVAEFFDGSVVIEWMDCPAFPNDVIWKGGKPGQMPKLLKCMDERRHVIFFDTRQNPFINYQELLNKWKHAPKPIRLARLAGITEKTAGSVFPRFGVNNILKHETIEAEFQKNPPTRYHFLDFAGDRNWFMLWFGLYKIGKRLRIVVYREWPDYDTYGEWALASDRPDGARGPAQTTQGFGAGDYKRLIKQLEKDETIFLRYGDPRSISATALAEEGTLTIQQMLLEGEDGIEVQPALSTDKMGRISEGINLINKWLEYNEEEPISVLNEPILYVSERCKNLITCMKMWTGIDGLKGAAKDPIDLLRYAAMVGIDYVDTNIPVSHGGGSY